MAVLATVDPDDVRTVLDDLDRRGVSRAATVAAATRLRSSIAPGLFEDPPLSDPAATLTPPAHRDAGDTELTARWAAMPRSGSARQRVLQSIARAGRDGRTDQELEHRLGLDRPTPGNRRNELVRGGWVRDSGERRDTTAGNPAVVWVLTDAGRARLGLDLDTYDLTPAPGGTP